MGSTGPLKAFVLGGTGECGKEIVRELAKVPAITSVTLIGRREIELPASSSEEGTDYTKFSQAVVDFDRLEEYGDVFQGFDMGFCALGTTQAKAGGKPGFYLVDHDYVVNSAGLAKAGGCKHMTIISSTSANKNSFIYYSKVKGRMEEDVIALGFERLTFARPGLLLCKRTEQRTGEKLMGSVLGAMDKWRATCVETSKVARTLIANSLKPSTGAVEILDNAALNKEGN